jgi:hypothetical protein
MINTETKYVIQHRHPASENWHDSDVGSMVFRKFGEVANWEHTDEANNLRKLIKRYNYEPNVTKAEIVNLTTELFYGHYSQYEFRIIQRKTTVEEEVLIRISK